MVARFLPTRWVPQPSLHCDRACLAKEGQLLGGAVGVPFYCYNMAITCQITDDNDITCDGGNLHTSDPLWLPRIPWSHYPLPLHLWWAPFSFACAAKEKWIEAPPTRDHKALKPMLAQWSLASFCFFSFWLQAVGVSIAWPMPILVRAPGLGFPRLRPAPGAMSRLAGCKQKREPWSDMKWIYQTKAQWGIYIFIYIYILLHI